VLIDRLEHGLSRLARSHGGLAVLYLDLDRFKVVNDSLGHHVGDGVLLQMAERLTHHLRPSDTLARLRGDEFVIVAEDVDDEAKAVELAHRIVDTGRHPFEVGDERFECTVSVGIAVTSDPRRGAEDLLQEADLALYRAKDRGRDRAELYDEDLRSAALGRLATERLVQRAIDERRLVVDYQPIIDLATGRVRSAEALVRIRDPAGGVLLPESFLDVAEETGLLVDIDEHVLADAIQRAADWRIGLGDAWFGGVAINVTARHLADANFRDSVCDQLDALEVPHHELHVEVTERVLMDASNSAMSGLHSLRDAGVQVGLDDFGTGFSSLACLRRFPLDFVKIDRTCIADLERGDAEGAIVAAIIEVAHALGLTVVAEGVETFRQREVLKALGCDCVQGFLFARPSDPKAIDEVVRSQPRLR
jgi:diguanylate cyclase (GGDEF)-like protein